MANTVNSNGQSGKGHSGDTKGGSSHFSVDIRLDSGAERRASSQSAIEGQGVDSKRSDNSSSNLSTRRSSPVLESAFKDWLRICGLNQTVTTSGGIEKARERIISYLEEEAKSVSALLVTDEGLTVKRKDQSREYLKTLGELQEKLKQMDFSNPSLESLTLRISLFQQELSMASFLRRQVLPSEMARDNKPVDTNPRLQSVEVVSANPVERDYRAGEQGSLQSDAVKSQPAPENLSAFSLSIKPELLSLLLFPRYASGDQAPQPLKNPAPDGLTPPIWTSRQGEMSKPPQMFSYIPLISEALPPQSKKEARAEAEGESPPHQPRSDNPPKSDATSQDNGVAARTGTDTANNEKGLAQKTDGATLSQTRTASSDKVNNWLAEEERRRVDLAIAQLIEETGTLPEGCQTVKALNAQAQVLRDAINADPFFTELGVNLPASIKVVVLTTDVALAFIYPARPDRVFISVGELRQTLDPVTLCTILAHEQAHPVLRQIQAKQAQTAGRTTMRAGEPIWQDPLQKALAAPKKRDFLKDAFSQQNELFCDTYGAFPVLNAVNIDPQKVALGWGKSVALSEDLKLGLNEDLAGNLLTLTRSHPPDKERMWVAGDLARAMSYPATLSKLDTHLPEIQKSDLKQASNTRQLVKFLSEHTKFFDCLAFSLIREGMSHISTPGFDIRSFYALPDFSHENPFDFNKAQFAKLSAEEQYSILLLLNWFVSFHRQGVQDVLEKEERDVLKLPFRTGFGDLDYVKVHVSQSPQSAPISQNQKKVVKALNSKGAAVYEITEETGDYLRAKQIFAQDCYESSLEKLTVSSKLSLLDKTVLTSIRRYPVITAFDWKSSMIPGPDHGDFK